MKHIFVINPLSGKKDISNILIKELEQNYSSLDYEIYITKEMNDATRFVHEYATNNNDELCFYACGGDGTLNEVVNGAVGFPHVRVGCYASGSGNDFIKVFADREFTNLDKIINGEEKLIDLIKVNDRYVINMCNVGFDANVAANTIKFKRLPLMNGKRSYNLALFYSLLFKMKSYCKIKLDDLDTYEGKILLTVSSNGICCGGSYYCCPNALVDDGLIDVVIVKSVGRIKFLRLVGKYKDGTYVNVPKYQSFVTTKKIKKVEITANKDLVYCLDGEILRSNHLNITIEQKVLKFNLPKK